MWASAMNCCHTCAVFPGYLRQIEIQTCSQGKFTNWQKQCWWRKRTFIILTCTELLLTFSNFQKNATPVHLYFLESCSFAWGLQIRWGFHNCCIKLWVRLFTLLTWLISILKLPVCLCVCVLVCVVCMMTVSVCICACEHEYTCDIGCT